MDKLNILKIEKMLLLTLRNEDSQWFSLVVRKINFLTEEDLTLQNWGYNSPPDGERENNNKSAK